MRLAISITLLFFASLLVGCGGSESTPMAAELPLNTDVVLRIGETRHISGSRISIYFADVPEDTRCPINALCIAAGTATVRMGFYLDNQRSSPSGQYQESTFSLGSGGYTTAPGYGGNQQYRIVMTAVEPSRTGFDPINKGDYRVTFRVTTAP